VATLVGLGVLAFFMMWVSLTWQRDEVNGLLTQRAGLKAEIVQLEGEVAELEKKQKVLKQPRRIPKASAQPGEVETE
jgi:phage shock protein A